MVGIIEVNENNRQEIMKGFIKRSTGDLKEYREAVAVILEEVNKRGDEAVFRYTEKYDGVLLNETMIRVSEEELEEAYGKVGESFKKAVEVAIEKIRAYHERQKEESWFTFEEGITLGQKITAISTVGIYVPGGTAAYPSSVVMNAIPAMVAGVEKIVMVTPPNKEGKVNDGVLAVAKALGIKEIYKVGGAQAIAALAYGTKTIPKVDKIVGPGNIYVAVAKSLVYGMVDIDMIAGPSEILVVADATANPRFVAADLLSQAEHDELATAVCITSSRRLAEEIREEIALQTEVLQRRDIINKSLEDHGGIYVVEDINEAIEMANIIAPEHLELSVENPFELLNLVKNAGAIFMGHYSPEALGDYMAGPNHVLPTSGTARFFSPLGVGDFLKKSSIIYYQRNALEKVKEDIMVMAAEEGLTAHKNAVKVRFDT